jgi:hypothetical protein
VAEVFVEFTEPVLAEDGREYLARACGAEDAKTGLWQGWIEFIPRSGGEPVRSRRETTQPNRQDLEYWATGLTPVYLEGALHRTLTPRVAVAPPPAPAPAFDGPAPETLLPGDSSNSVLNPFSVYRKGEKLLRRQLAAFSTWHLVNIIRAHDLSEQDAQSLDALSDAELVELIVAAVRAQVESPANR